MLQPTLTRNRHARNAVLLHPVTKVISKPTLMLLQNFVIMPVAYMTKTATRTRTLTTGSCVIFTSLGLPKKISCQTMTVLPLERLEMMTSAMTMTKAVIKTVIVVAGGAGEKAVIKITGIVEVAQTVAVPVTVDQAPIVVEVPVVVQVAVGVPVAVGVVVVVTAATAATAATAVTVAQAIMTRRKGEGSREQLHYEK